MAQFETWLHSDLQSLPQVEVLEGSLFTGDKSGNIIGAIVTNGGSAASLSGSVIGYIIRPDGGTLNVTGTISGNRAFIILPEAAYVYDGPIDIVIKVISGNVKTVVGACRGYVHRTTTDTIVDPSHVVPDLDDLLAQIDTMETATAAANTAASSANSAATKITGMDAVATTLAAGSSATVSVSTVSGHYRISLGIPQGAKGDKGNKGDTGSKGDTGDTGPQGPKGDTGATGPQGSKGDTGNTGPQGPQGEQGIQGPKGDTGSNASVISSVTTYQNSTTGTTPPSGTWSETVPQTPQGNFLWARTVITWNNNATTTIYIPTRFGVDGALSMREEPDSHGGTHLIINTSNV